MLFCCKVTIIWSIWKEKKTSLTDPEDLQKIDNKIDVCKKLLKTLDEGLTVQDKLSAFKTAFNQDRAVLEQSRDSGLMKFLKIVGTVVSLGLAYHSLWNVKGKETTEKIDAEVSNIVDPNP